MKKFLVVLLVLTMSVPAAHAFNVWDYVSDAPTPQYDFSDTSRAGWIANARLYLPIAVRDKVDLEMTLVLGKLSLLAHYPNTNVPTNALLMSSLPSGDSGHREVRWLAAFLDEVQSGYAGLNPQVDGWVLPEVVEFLNSYSWKYVVDGPIYNWVEMCNRRAKQIVAQMALMESKRMTALASDVLFVRESARVKLGEIPGFMLTAGRQNLNVKVREGGVAQFYAPLTTLDMAYADIAVGTAGTATAHLTAKSQPLLVSLGDGTPTVMSPNANQSFTSTQVAQGIKAWIMAVPTVVQHVGNQTLRVGVRQTVNYQFGGELLRYSVNSSQPSVCTVSLSQDTGIAVLQGVRAGNATITITATNSAGSAVTSFIATIEASD